MAEAPLDALSLRYLKRLGQVETKSFEEFEREVVQPETRNQICPRDGKEGCSYVDAVKLTEASGAKSTGKATHLLSFPWEHLISAVVDSLTHYSSRARLDVESFYVWLDVLCLNQHRLRNVVPECGPSTTSHLVNCYSNLVSEIGHVLAMFSPFDEPLCVRDTWCAFEFYAASQLATDGKCQLELLLTSHDLVKFEAELHSFRAVCLVSKALGSTSVKDSQTKRQCDHSYILEKIQTEVGVEEFDIQIRRMMKQQLCKEALTILQSHEASRQRWSNSTANLYYHVARLWRFQSCSRKIAVSICEEGVRHFQAAVLREGYQIREEDVQLCLEEGLLKFHDGNEDCVSLFMTILSDCQKNHLKGTYAEGWNLMLYGASILVLAKLDRGPDLVFIEKALLKLQEAANVLRSQVNPEEKTFKALQFCLWLLGASRTLMLEKRQSTGQIATASDFETVEKCFRESQIVRETNVPWQGQNAFFCIAFGKFKLFQGDYSKAQALLEEGHNLLSNQLEEEYLPELAEALMKQAEAHLALSNLDEACALYHRSLVLWDRVPLVIPCSQCQVEAVEASYKLCGLMGSADLLSGAEASSRLVKYQELLECRKRLLCRRCQWVSARWV